MLLVRYLFVSLVLEALPCSIAVPPLLRLCVTASPRPMQAEAVVAPARLRHTLTRDNRIITELCALQGDGLFCPAQGFTLGSRAPAGRLDGLMCYSASSSDLITDATPMANITSMVFYEHHGLSSGAAAGIVILMLVLVAALAGAPQLITSASCKGIAHAVRLAAQVQIGRPQL